MGWQCDSEWNREKILTLNKEKNYKRIKFTKMVQVIASDSYIEIIFGFRRIFLGFCWIQQSWLRFFHSLWQSIFANIDLNRGKGSTIVSQTNWRFAVNERTNEVRCFHFISRENRFNFQKFKILLLLLERKQQQTDLKVLKVCRENETRWMENILMLYYRDCIM